MYYNEGEDQQYVQKKKPYNEACDLGHDFDMADDEARAESSKRSRSESQSGRGNSKSGRSKSQSSRSKGRSGKISSKSEM